jgi:vitamin B12 transporter
LIKKLMRFLFLSVLLITCFFGAAAQEVLPDTILLLDDVTIYSPRISRFAKGQDMQVPDSLARSEAPASSLAELINGFTSAYVRNYGQGTLSTLSFRGTSANHTSLLWNGIRISPPNIGYLDLSLVQQSFFNTISVLYGGASPMFGSGAIGGSIHLDNRPEFDKPGVDATLGISGGSFKTMSAESAVDIRRENFYSRTAFSIFNSPNDFSYQNLNGEEENLSHADVFRSGIIQDISFQLPGKQYVMGSGWFNYAERNIPPTMSQENSEAVQIDRSWRTMLLWKDYNARNILEAKLAYFNDFTRYDDPPSAVFSTIKSQSLTASFESTWEIGKNSALFGGTQYTYEYADLVYYNSPEDQQTLALFASYKIDIPSIDWHGSLNGRQEMLSGYKSPFLFSAGAEGRIWRFLSGRFNISRNFRAPTLNERFWQPGGNPDLQPEKSWNEEAGLAAEQQFSNGLIKIRLTVFNSNVDNWILWLPGSSYWSVENAQEVWSRGMEISGDQSVKLNEVTLFTSESYTYSKSTNEKKLFDLDASYKKQLIYTPLHRFTLRAGALYKGFNLTAKGNYTGLVFTTKDNLQTLPGYFLFDLILSKTIAVNNQYPITMQLNFNNIFNVDYQVVPYRPMPGMNFMLTVKAALSAVSGQRSAVGSQRSAVSGQRSAVIKN